MDSLLWNLERAAQVGRRGQAGSPGRAAPGGQPRAGSPGRAAFELMADRPPERKKGARSDSLLWNLERETRFELATSTLARLRSTS